MLSWDCFSVLVKKNDDAIETGPNVQITIHQTPAINKTRDTNAAINCKSR